MSDNKSSSASLLTYTGSVFVGFKFRSPKPPQPKDDLDELIDDADRVVKGAKKIGNSMKCTLL